MKGNLLSVWVAFALFVFGGGNLFAHCEIPCGIYNDRMRIDLMLEDIQTIQKSMKQISLLEKDSHGNANQLTRWIMNKEKHAGKIQEIATQYFLTQRIKFDAKDYDKKLALLHQILVYSMKCKQTVDLANAEKLKKAVEEFAALYFGEKKETGK
jgi:nickel superoxide dismutase